MKETLIDTDILSLFLRGNKNVVSRFEEYLKYYSTINISILSYYEILSGLKYKDANRQLESFLELSKVISIIPVTLESSDISADIYGKLRKDGNIIDDVDILIAGICLENGFVLSTNNTDHFSRIETLEITNWSK